MRMMTTQQEFWNWFLLHEAELFEFDHSREVERKRLFDRLAGELQKVDPDLTFEFGPPAESREFIVSAAGIRRAFPAVASLADAAPKLDRWRVIAFRPRRWPINVVDIDGRRVDPRDVQFTLLDNGKIAGINLFIPGFRESETDLKQIGYLLLDEALGEFDVESRLGLVRMLSPDARTDGDRYPLQDLPPLFDQLVSRLEGRGKRPS
jgi:hypothetical protein